MNLENIALGFVLGIVTQYAFKHLVAKIKQKKPAESKPWLSDYNPLDMTEIWLIRHGETNSNADKLCATFVNSDTVQDGKARKMFA